MYALCYEKSEDFNRKYSEIHKTVEYEDDI